MRTDILEAGGGDAQAAPGCSGFRIVFDEAGHQVKLSPGARRLGEGVPAAVVRGLQEAPGLLRDALQLEVPRRPYDRVEVVLGRGALTQGEAMPLGAGVIRLSLGEDATADDAARIARHEALHLLLARSLHGGAKWSDPELAFADWIVRGIEGGLDASLPRFRAPLPQVLETLPTTRLEVQRQLGNVSAAPAAARRYFGERLFTQLQRLESDAGAEGRALIEQRELWLVEAALGTHFIEAAASLRPGEADALRPVLLDDWILDYERHARALANAPSGAGNLWPLSSPEWSRDPLTRLSVAAQALQCDDQSHFGGERSRDGEPVVWKNGGRVRLPLLAAPSRVRPLPVHGFRAALRELRTPEGEKALALVEQAARGSARNFEARALWPRILSRLLASGAPALAGVADPAEVPSVLLVDLDGGESAAAFTEWDRAAAALRVLFPEQAAWVPRIAEPVQSSSLAELPRAAAAILLVHGLPLGPHHEAALLEARRLAARLPVRGTLFRDHLGGGKAFERLPDLERPIDPRYREEAWQSGPPLPILAAQLPAAADEATQAGALTTPLAHLLALMGVGVLECHYRSAI